MAVRRRALRPDSVIETATYGPLHVVSDEAFLAAVLAAAQTQALAGGVLTVLVNRHPTDVEHEMVTIGALIEWRDRTDARPQPERAQAVAVPQTMSPVEVEVDEPAAERVAEELDEAEADIDDGLDPATLAEEDVSSIPTTAR